MIDQSLIRYQLRTAVFVGILLLLVFGFRIVTAQEGEDVYVAAVVDNPNPYVGQQVVYSLQIFNRLPTELVADYSVPSFNGLWFAGYIDDTVSSRGTYRVRARDFVLFPNRAGQIVIDPTRLEIDAGITRNRQEMITEQIVLNVRPLPDNPPPGFNGAVGLFNVSIALSRLSATYGDPIQMQLRVQGTGNLQQMVPPDLPFADGWRIYEQPARYQEDEEEFDGRLLVGEKTFEWLFIPNEVGFVTLPSIPFTFFDPIDEIYKTVNTGEQTLEILPSSLTSNLPDIAASIPVEDDLRIELKPITPRTTAGLVPNLFIQIIVWMLPLSLVGVSVGWVEYAAHRRREAVTRRRQGALRSARRLLSNATQMSGDEAYRRIILAILNYFGDRWNDEPLSLVSQVIEQRLLVAGVDENTVSEILDCLQHAEEGRYAPVSNDSVRPLVQQSLMVLMAIESTLNLNGVS